MRRRDDFLPDPELVAVLEAIDATLAGEAVDPQHAEVAELALLVAADRPVIDSGFAARLDQRVQERAAPVTPGAHRKPRRRRVRWLVWAPASAVAASLAAAVVIVVSEGGPAVTAGGQAGVPGVIRKMAPARRETLDGTAATATTSHA